MEPPSGARPGSGHAWQPAREGLRGLVTILVGADQAPAWRSPWQRGAVYAALTAGTLACCALSLSSVSALTRSIQFANFTVFGKGGPLKAQATEAPPNAQATQVPAGGGLHRYFPGGRVNYKVGPPAWVHAVGVAPGLLTAAGTSIVIAVLVALAVVAPLPLAARYPLMGWRIGWLGLLLVPLAHVKWVDAWPWDPVQLAVLMVVFGVAGVRVRRASLWWMWALTQAAWWLQARAGHPGLLTAVGGSLVLTATGVAAGALGAWRGARQALASQAEQTELEQARRAVLEERAKIARELHDVVAHHMSLIAVRAETAPYRLAGLGEGALAEFASLSGGARSALADMRRLLGVLRADAPAALAPQPQLADLPALIEGARRAGVGVALRAGAAAPAVPPPVGVCAYRIVQESLSNASRHAPGAPVTVWVSHDRHTVLLRVENGPATTCPPATANGHVTVNAHATVNGRAGANGHAVNGQVNGQAVNGPGAVSTDTIADAHRAVKGPGAMNGLVPDGGSGHGLAGMRERVALLGGTLSAGPSPDGGFIVSAVLPLGEAA
jgi:signal transduction histidine kinase